MALPRARIVKDSDPVFQSCQVWQPDGADDSCDGPDEDIGRRYARDIPLRLRRRLSASHSDSRQANGSVSTLSLCPISSGLDVDLSGRLPDIPALQIVQQ